MSKTKNFIIGGTVAILAIGWIGSASSKDSTPTKKVEAAAPSSSEVTEAPTSTTEAPTTSEAPHVATESELNAAWAAEALDDSNALIDGFDQVATAAGNYDLDGTIAACEALKGPAQAFGDHAPDTEAGRHARKASTLYLAAAQACASGDLDGATTLMKAGGVELDASTAAIR